MLDNNVLMHLNGITVYCTATLYFRETAQFSKNLSNHKFSLFGVTQLGTG